MNLIKISLRNTRRHPRRTLLTGLAIGIAVAAVTYMDAHIIGITKGMFEAFIQLEAGHIKVVPVNAVDRIRPLPLDKGINDIEKLLSLIETTPGITDASPRIRFPVLMERSGDSVPAFGLALFPSRETGLINLENLIVEGSLPADSSDNILLGDQLAEKLGLTVGNELFMVTTDAYGGLGPGLYTIGGIIKSGVGSIDKRIFYVPMPAAQEQLAMEDAALEIVCRVKDGYHYSQSVADSLNGRFKQAGRADVIALPWQKQSILYSAMSQAKVIYFYIGLLLGIIALITVVNTVLMAVMERTREIGALRALGFDRRTIVRMILSESLVIGVFSTLAGMILGLTVALILHNVGIDLSGVIGDIDFPIRPIVYPEPNVLTAVKAAIFGLVVSLLAAWYPARIAVRLMPAEALRTE